MYGVARAFPPIPYKLGRFFSPSNPPKIVLSDVRRPAGQLASLGAALQAYLPPAGTPAVASQLTGHGPSRRDAAPQDPRPTGQSRRPAAGLAPPSGPDPPARRLHPRPRANWPRPPASSSGPRGPQDPRPTGGPRPPPPSGPLVAAPQDRQPTGEISCPWERPPRPGPRERNPPPSARRCRTR